MRQCILLVLAAVFLLAVPAMAEEAFPDLPLSSSQLDQDQKAYLGIDSESFKVSDIKADYLFIEAYSMYCPICQRDAQHINDLYKTVSAMDGGPRIRFLGLALGNTQFEVEFYKKKYHVEFPLFKDDEYALHKALGEVPTPTFYIVKLGGTPEVLYMKEGEAKTKEALLNVIKEKVGLE